METTSKLRRQEMRVKMLAATAQLIPEAWDVPEGFTPGEFVAVRFLRKAFGVLVFQCTNAAGNIAAICELELDNFVL